MLTGFYGKPAGKSPFGRAGCRGVIILKQIWKK
jgi:hypothetical protein